LNNYIIIPGKYILQVFLKCNNFNVRLRFGFAHASRSRGLFDPSGHGVLPALAGFRKDPSQLRLAEADAWTPQRDVLRSAPILARPAASAGFARRRSGTPRPLESARLFSNLPELAKRARVKTEQNFHAGKILRPRDPLAWVKPAQLKM